ncbi:hypothetical protein HZA38_00630 [Candidatus Peregrinibacteria bacterium]|nr:hypothetical protein [Candidatus Peregrinibacteria bacterium]
MAQEEQKPKAEEEKNKVNANLDLTEAAVAALEKTKKTEVSEDALISVSGVLQNDINQINDLISTLKDSPEKIEAQQQWQSFLEKKGLISDNDSSDVLQCLQKEGNITNIGQLRIAIQTLETEMNESIDAAKKNEKAKLSTQEKGIRAIEGFVTKFTDKLPFGESIASGIFLKLIEWIKEGFGWAIGTELDSFYNKLWIKANLNATIKLMESKKYVVQAQDWQKGIIALRDNVLGVPANKDKDFMKEMNARLDDANFKKFAELMRTKGYSIKPDDLTLSSIETFGTGDFIKTLDGKIKGGATEEAVRKFIDEEKGKIKIVNEENKKVFAEKIKDEKSVGKLLVIYQFAQKGIKGTEEEFDLEIKSGTPEKVKKIAASESLIPVLTEKIAEELHVGKVAVDDDGATIKNLQMVGNKQLPIDKIALLEGDKFKITLSAPLENGGNTLDLDPIQETSLVPVVDGIKKLWQGDVTHGITEAGKAKTELDKAKGQIDKMYNSLKGKSLEDVIAAITGAEYAKEQIINIAQEKYAATFGVPEANIKVEIDDKNEVTIKLNQIGTTPPLKDVVITTKDAKTSWTVKVGVESFEITTESDLLAKITELKGGVATTTPAQSPVRPAVQPAPAPAPAAAPGAPAQAQ